VVEDVADLGFVEARVDRHQRTAHEQHREVRREQGGHVRGEHRDAITRCDPRAHERTCEAADVLAELGPGAAHAAVDHRGLVRNTRTVRSRKASGVSSSRARETHHARHSTMRAWPRPPRWLR
jgi:hypothetical protein